MPIQFRLLFLLTPLFSIAQNGYWQQHVEYKMDVELHSSQHKITGRQSATYTNHSPDTLHVIYYHLYYNAFQPGSMMDIRSQNVTDPDSRIGNRIAALKENEQGFHKIVSLNQNGLEINYQVSGTLMKVHLSNPLFPGEKTKLDMVFESQVPVQIRRTGRDNIEGVEYSMAQWYPKIAAYDKDGWHADPYVSREFYGVFGNFDVSITIDSAYTVAATGQLQNPEEIGKGYGEKKFSTGEPKLTWHFKAEKVHDFVWAADRNYLHRVLKSDNGPEFHFFFKDDTLIRKNWESLPSYLDRCFLIMKDLVGPYPYPVFSVIQAGDGGMEYPMATLILGNGKLRGLVGVTVHEAIHSWFQGVLGSNETAYPWMDEGFNTYFEHIVMDSLFPSDKEFIHSSSYNAYFAYLNSDDFEPISLHADFHKTNRSYGISSYAMGCVILAQLEYIIGSDAFTRTFRRYYEMWKFKHPSPEYFYRCAETESKMELDWYFNLFVHTGRKINYGISDFNRFDGASVVRIENKGDFPMPVDVVVTLEGGIREYYTIPLNIMLERKTRDGGNLWISAPSWAWTNKTYELSIPHKKNEIIKIELDPSFRNGDIDRKDNVYPKLRQKEEK